MAPDPEPSPESSEESPISESISPKTSTASIGSLTKVIHSSNPGLLQDAEPTNIQPIQHTHKRIPSISFASDVAEPKPRPTKRRGAVTSPPPPVE